MRKLTIPAIAGVIIAGLFTAVDASAAEPHRNRHTGPTPYVACFYEDSKNCVWDAKHMGNGEGRSFVINRTGKLTFVPHRVAHLLTVR